MQRLGRRSLLVVAILGGALIIPSGSSGGVILAAGSSGSGGTGPGTPGPNVVLTGAYTCTYQVSMYTITADAPPVSYGETFDYISMGTTGAIESVPMGAMPAPAIGPGFGGRQPIVGGGTGRPVGSIVAPVLVPTVTPMGGSGTGHTFEGGSLEECVRFAQAVAEAASGHACTTSDVNRRQPPASLYGSTSSASVTFVCEGPAPAMVHLMGDLDRTVLALQLQPTP